jgi:flagellar protein FlbT
MVIGGAVITNGDSKCDLIIENKVPLLREKNILKEEEANTPGRRIYFVIQLMYIDEENLTTHHKNIGNWCHRLFRLHPVLWT